MPYSAENKQVVIIVGPTAIGKTSLSLELSQRFSTEIVSADSRQIYRYMNIGTAKPTQHELHMAPHHFIDIKNPDEYYSAGMYGEEARLTIDDLLKKEKLPVVVGGSGFYIQALVDGFDDVAAYDSDIKLELQQRVQTDGLGKLYAELQLIDRTTAERLHPNDTQRILRALEVWQITGKPISVFQVSQLNPCQFSPIYIGLMLNRQKLYKQIEKRVDEMVARGLVDEVKHLQELGYNESLQSLRTVGYQEVFEFLHGQYPIHHMVGLIKQKTRNYAKRQITWYKRDNRIRWFDTDDKYYVSDIIKYIESELVRQDGNG
ncbi:tRNA (adenosine(37)-N6)-dimethylallyltransferase MiaA [candidate division KSB1 bacterium]|nr:tRNA (adenosine(37)-N6)-dimethylallyltransferase MiaA [candidate division KSB1 bacterium]